MTKINWNEAIVKPFEYIKKHRYLWWLGLLAALTEGGSSWNFGNYSGGNWSADGRDFENFSNTAGTWASQHSFEIGIISAGIFLISLVVLYASYSARAGLIQSVDLLDSDKNEINFNRAFSAGQKYFWRFLGLTLLIALVIFALIVALIVIIGGFVALAVTLSLWFLLLTIPIGIAGIMGFILLAIYLNLVMTLSYRQIVIDDRRIVEATKAARKLIADNFSRVLIAWLIQLAIGTAVGLVLLVAMVFIGGALFLLGIGIYFLVKWIGVIVYAIPVGLALLAVGLVISGVINAYFSAYWTVVYKKLVN